VDNLTIKDYNNLLVSNDFYNFIPTEVFLIFQTDTIICKENKNIINDFIKYDYVGAPLKARLVGNGGLSLRRKSKMLNIINNCKYNNEPEDVYFSVACNLPLNKPSFEEAKNFSVEGVYNDNSFGIHKIWRFFNKNIIKNKNNYCSGLNKLIELNN
jgi:hypothetical protein